MVEHRNLNVDDIFLTALELANSAARADYLEQACAGAPEVRRRVERLLAAQLGLGSFLELPAPEFVRTVQHSGAEGLGAQIGPYKLLQQIGEGGFGVVFMAEQMQPIRRKVALKIIKPGMDTQEVMARFETERQVLALMDHPHIAQVLDAGATQSGRPYFVMELVRGVPITDYCDEQMLAPRQRLELFVDICRAVQHAHQKGIIHRDLKPSNIMVTLHDDKPVVKVIDFGVAKALNQELTNRTLFTAYGQMIGTPLYMSPEQAQLSGLDVDTRSDVYSLGVFLDELLTGTTPFDKEILRTSGFDEMRRVIREVEPLRPSAKISTLRADLLSTVSRTRRIDPRTLSTSYRGELDWIAMKALEKNRNRRYESASAMAADVDRFRAHEPVQARPPSLWYQLQKLARRRRTALVTTAIVVAAILLGAASIGWTIRDRASREQVAVRERRERQTRLAAQLELILADATELLQGQRWSESLSSAKRAEAIIAGVETDGHLQQLVRALLRDLQLVERLDLARHRKTAWAVTHFDHAGAAEEFAAAFRDYGISVLDLPTDQAAAALRSKPDLLVPCAVALDDWAGSFNQLRRGAEARRLLALADAIDPSPWRRGVRAALLHTGSDEDRDAMLRQLAATAPVGDVGPASFWQLASELRHRGHVEEATALLRRAQAARAADYWINFDLATFCDEEASLELAQEAATFYRVALAIRPDSAAALTGLGNALTAAGKRDEAVDCQRRAIAIDPQCCPAWVNLGRALAAQDKLDEAIDCFDKALELAPTQALVHFSLGETLREQGRLEQAIHAFQRAVALDPQYAAAHNNLGIALLDAGSPDQAIVHFNLAVQIDPSYVIAYNNLGNAQTAATQLEMAIGSYRKSIQLDSRFAAAHYNLGNVLMKLGRLDEAAACWKDAIAVDPKSVRPECTGAYGNLGIHWAQQGDFDAAIDCWTKGLDLNPRNNQMREYLVRAVLTRARQRAEERAAQRAVDECCRALQFTADRSEQAFLRLRKEAQQLLQEALDSNDEPLDPSTPQVTHGPFD